MKSKIESRTENESEKEKVEGLMKPRWKCIVPYPRSKFRVGEILDRNWGWDGDDEVGFSDCIDNYPHLFKKMEWPEEREEIEMPVYVKIIKNKPIYDLPVGCVRAVNGWDKNRDGKYVVCDIFPLWTNIKDIEPATKEEYESYLNKNK